MNELDIQYEDEAIIVCRKPAGTATQTRRFAQQDMESLLRSYRAKKGEAPYIGIVHRLDQPVEGVMVFAKTKAAAADLSRQLQTHRFGKHYCAIAGAKGADKTIPTGGTLSDYMIYDPRANLAAIVTEDTPRAKKAVLDYQIKEGNDDRILFDITLRTGRHHQIRLQLAHMGFPILGDTKYGGIPWPGRRGAIGLSAYRLDFTHPVTRKELSFTIEPEILSQMRG